ncbi:sensor domain-containing phosphodiesterase [Pararhizobium haloflavum]|uniref:sensor domain-containing phosphodiesterase n=1 Tax=Pararhizobium haloflavum TaxID=2037914 RepID=UPI000C1A6B82|nr:EAL domain-containing protein [Pararhizobium haloflavum]
MNQANKVWRAQVLDSYQILDTEPDPIFDALTHTAARIFGVSTSLISFVDRNRQWFKARVGFDQQETGLEESFCRWAIEQDDVFVVNDASHDRRFADIPFVKDGRVRFYAGAPLLTAENCSLGTICVLDGAPRTPDKGQINLLRDLARITISLLDARRLGFDMDASKVLVNGLTDNAPGGIFEFKRDRSGHQRLSFASRGFIDTIGICPHDAVMDIGRAFANVHPDDLPGFLASIDAVYRTASAWEHQFRVQHPVKGTLWVLGASHPVSNVDGLITWQGCLMDVTERVAEQERLEEARRTLEHQYRELSEYQMLMNQIARMSKVGAWAVQIDTGAVSWTPEVYALHGVTPDTFDASLDSALGLCDPAARPLLKRKLQQIAETGETMEMEYAIITPAGERRWVRTIGEVEHFEDGRPARLVGSVQDITEMQELLAGALYHSSHDHMTGLSNRASFFRQLEDVLSRRADGQSHALLFFDLDHFKDINDAFGYEAGDAVIKEVARRLSDHLAGEPDALFARFGGDEFAVLLAGADDAEAVRLRARCIKQAITREVAVKDRHLTSRLSMGIALSDTASETAAGLFRKADLALRQAKQSGRARFVFYTDAMATATEREQELRRAIVAGIEHGEFEVHYQPIMDLGTARLDGFEALLRWHHPQRGLVSAGVFAHLIDDPVIGHRLSDLVFSQVIETAARWSAEELHFGQIAVNISSSQLRDPSFLDQLRRVEAAGLPTSCIKLEITEGVLFGRTADKAAQVLATIRDMGFDIALDDFGTGYASLVHLTQFPITQLKIDMSFVRKMADSEKDRTIVQTMCTLAHGLDLTAVAEGIEDKETETMLHAMGCRFGQGYLYAKALPHGQARRFIIDHLAPSTPARILSL